MAQAMLYRYEVGIGNKYNADGSQKSKRNQKRGAVAYIKV